MPFDAWFCALDVTSNYTCSLYHIVLHCLLTDNTATSHCKPNRACERVFVQLSLKEAGALPNRSDSITFRRYADCLNEYIRFWKGIFKTGSSLWLDTFTVTSIISIASNFIYTTIIVFLNLQFIFIYTKIERDWGWVLKLK